jgi:hypothetical protein
MLFLQVGSTIERITIAAKLMLVGCCSVVNLGTERASRFSDWLTDSQIKCEPRPRSALMHRHHQHGVLTYQIVMVSGALPSEDNIN